MLCIRIWNKSDPDVFERIGDAYLKITFFRKVCIKYMYVREYPDPDLEISKVLIRIQRQNRDRVSTYYGGLILMKKYFELQIPLKLLIFMQKYRKQVIF
jgi:hypothetical protein